MPGEDRERAFAHIRQWGDPVLRETARPVTSELPSGSGPLESAQELAQGLTAEFHARLAHEAAIGEGR